MDFSLRSALISPLPKKQSSRCMISDLTHPKPGFASCVDPDFERSLPPKSPIYLNVLGERPNRIVPDHNLKALSRVEEVSSYSYNFLAPFSSGYQVEN